MSGLGGALSLYVKVPTQAQVTPGGWEAGESLGVPVWHKRVVPHGSLDSLKVVGRDLPNPVPQLVVGGGDRSRLVPWIWFFRDYLGVEPDVAEAIDDSRFSVVLAEDPPRGGTVVILEGRGEIGTEGFVFADEIAKRLGCRGLRFPFRGHWQSVERDDSDALVLDSRNEPVAVIESGPATRFLFGFDPLASLWRDSQADASAHDTALHAGWIPVMLRLLVRASPFCVWKGFWPDDIAPLVYSVDVEAGASYYDPGAGRCAWARDRRRVRHPADTKLENSLRLSAERLERRGLIGTFHIDLNAVRDQADSRAIREVSDRHDIAFHLPRVGGHAEWRNLVRDPARTADALAEGVRTLADLSGRLVLGNRYGSWARTSETHDVVAAAGLGYDSSSLAHAPFWTVPYRMASSATAAPLDLWEFPCMEVIGAVKAGPRRFVGVGARLRMVRAIRRRIRSAARDSFMVVLCDHDMALGAAKGHVHGTWRLDPVGLWGVLDSASRHSSAGRMRPVAGSEFLGWWRWTRDTRFTIAHLTEGKGEVIRVGVGWPARSRDERGPTT